MVQLARKHYHKIKRRLHDLLHRISYESAEMGVALAAVWQAWRLVGIACNALVTGPHMGTGLKATSTRLTNEGDAFFQSLLNHGPIINLEHCAFLICLLAVLSWIGLLEEWDGMRLTCLSLATAWFAWIGLTLCFYTPGHVGGGLHLVVALGAGWTFVRMQREVGNAEGKILLAQNGHAAERTASRTQHLEL